MRQISIAYSGPHIGVQDVDVSRETIYRKSFTPPHTIPEKPPMSLEDLTPDQALKLHREFLQERRQS